MESDGGQQLQARLALLAAGASPRNMTQSNEIFQILYNLYVAILTLHIFTLLYLFSPFTLSLST